MERRSGRTSNGPFFTPPSGRPSSGGLNSLLLLNQIPRSFVYNISTPPHHSDVHLDEQQSEDIAAVIRHQLNRDESLRICLGKLQIVTDMIYAAIKYAGTSYNLGCTRIISLSAKHDVVTTRSLLQESTMRASCCIKTPMTPRSVARTLT